MPRGKNTISVQAYLPAEWGSRLDALIAERGQSESSVVGDAVRDFILAYEGQDTNRSKLKRIEAQMAHIEQKINLALYVAWFAASQGGEVEIVADQVRKIKAMLAEIVLSI